MKQESKKTHIHTHTCTERENLGKTRKKKSIIKIKNIPIQGHDAMIREENSSGSSSALDQHPRESMTRTRWPGGFVTPGPRHSAAGKDERANVQLANWQINHH